METIIQVRYLESDEILSVPISGINWDVVTYINIFPNKLTDLNWMKPCSNLQYLAVWHDNLSSLSGLPKELPNLQCLYLCDTNLSSLSGLPEELPNLQKLNISYNNLSSLSGLPEELPNLQQINISSNGLSSLSGLPEELPNLQNLDIHYNKLSSLSGLPQELLNLQYLDLAWNNLSSLSDLPEELPNLQKLLLCNNNLSSLSGLPEELPNLRSLNLYKNKLSSLSGLPEELPNLQHLSLSRNNLSSLSGLPQELPNLQYLYLSYNNLSSLSGLPEELPNLQNLDIWNNKLSSLSGLPEELPNLQILDLRYNNLSSLSGLPEELPSLQNINIVFNNLSSLEGLPQELPNLQILDIGYNAQITTLPNFLINYRNLQLLDYEGLELELEPRMRRWLNRLHNHGMGTTTQVYGNSQNVHDSSIQETVRQSMKKLLGQPNMQKLCLDTLRTQIVQDNILTPKSKDQLVEYIQSEEELHELCLTYSDLLWVVWQTIQGYSETIQDEIKSILNQELQDSDCKCFTGRMTRLVNCLNGFCDLVEVKILDSAQIGNIVLLLKQKLESSDGGYSIEKHKTEFREEMLSRGENMEVISEWLEYIE